jgi:hypothetical protein
LNTGKQKWCPDAIDAFLRCNAFSHDRFPTFHNFFNLTSRNTSLLGYQPF